MANFWHSTRAGFCGRSHEFVALVYQYELQARSGGKPTLGFAFRCHIRVSSLHCALRQKDTRRKSNPPTLPAQGGRVRVDSLGMLTAAELIRCVDAFEHAQDDIRNRSSGLAEQATNRNIVEPRLLGVVTETWNQARFSPFFIHLLGGIRSRARASDCDVVLLDNDETSLVRRCQQYGVDGVILHGLTSDHLQAQRLADEAIPCVTVDGGGLGQRLGHVESDNVGGGRLAVAHLYKHGRRRIAAIAGPENQAASKQRLFGYRIELESLGLPFSGDYVIRGDFSHRHGAAAVRKLLTLAEPPDAIFAVADVIAVGALAAIEAAGLLVPDDLAIVGFDDTDYAALLTPRLTTVRQDREGLGATAAEALLRTINYPDDSPPHVVFPAELIVRESCGCRAAD